MHIFKGFLLLSFLAANQSIWSAPIYKTVDEHGNTTYSSIPAEEAKEVALPSGPTQQQMDDAQKRLESTQRQTKEMSKERKAREASRPKPAPAPTTSPELIESSGYDYELSSGGIKPGNRIPNTSPGDSHPVYKPRPRPMPRGK